MKHILSLGAGVQSSTLAMMAAAGQIAPMPDCAVFADTMNEPAAVYRWLDWLERQLPFPVHRVSRGDLWRSAIDVRTTRDGQRRYIRTGIPIYFVNQGVDGGIRRGIGMRHCTRDFKTSMIVQEVKRLVGLKRASATTPVLATVWIGISADEAKRAKPSREPWIVARHPLLEMGMDRRDCLDWMRDHGHPEPPRSACIFCPFRSDDFWLALEPEELKRVAEMERELQSAYAESTEFTGVPYFHASRVPLSEVKFELAADSKRVLLGPECEGFCGV